MGFCFDFSKMYNQNVVLCMAVFDKKKNKANKRTLKEMEDLYRRSDNRIERFYPIFAIVEGIPVKFTQNFN